MKDIILPDAMLRAMRPEDRASLGKAGQTSEEAQAKFLAGEEDKLQEAIRKYLTLHGIHFINPSMRRRSALPKGWPDFTFSYRGTPMAVEAKTEVGKCDADQLECHARLTKDGWSVLVARTLDDIQRAFRAIDKMREESP